MANKPSPKSSMKKTAAKPAIRTKKKKTAIEKKVGTTSGATQLTFAVAQNSDGPAAQSTYVLLDAMLNIINRRLYRQHKVYCAKAELANPNTDQTPIGVYVLRNTWAVRKALAEGKHVYDQAVKEERAVVGNARWHDFRINATGAWNASAGASPLIVDGVNSQYLPITTGALGEYTTSDVATTDANGVEQVKSFTLRATSQSNSYSVWEEFQKMGPKTQTSPISSSPGGYDRARGTDFEDRNVEELTGDGNQAPYNPEDLGLAGPWVKVGEIGRRTSGGMITSTGYFEAPLGIVVLHQYNVNAQNRELPLNTGVVEMTVKEGEYKGVCAYDI